MIHSSCRSMFHAGKSSSISDSSSGIPIIAQLNLYNISDFHCKDLLVLFPDPALKEGKSLVHIECFLGLDEVSVRNSNAPIRFTPCGIHVIIM